jgi:flagellar hook-associated protein 1 FlgK
VLVEGLAAGLRIAASVDPAQGGVLARLRDGGISDPGDPAYVHNATGAAGFSTRLIELIDRLSASQLFDPGAGISTGPTGVLAYAADSAGWLEATRAGNHEQLESKRVLAERTLGAWQSRIGVDLDGELAALIALERSYQASSRLISSVDGMFDALLLAIR